MTTPAVPGPPAVSEVQAAMAAQAQMRNERIATQISAAPLPAFQPSLADRVALPQTAADRDREFLQKVAPAAEAAANQNAIGVLTRAAGRPMGPVDPRLAPTTPFHPELRPGAPRPARMQLPMQAGQGQPKPDPIADHLRGDGFGRLGVTIDDAMTQSLTGAMYLQWVRMARYPWWWGPIVGGLVQVEQMLARDNALFQASRMPAVTKSIFESNISVAMNWSREQRAAYAARTGGTPVPV
ncbi:MAG TPA: hypothetical protein VIP77_06635 [Jiangellaceae bacterium]